MDEVARKRIKELDRKVNGMLKAMKILSKWIKEQEAITKHDTNLFHSINRRLEHVEGGWLVSRKKRDKK